MKWFRHFVNASNSVKLNRIIDDLGVEGYGRYWLFLELLASHYDGDSAIFEIHSRELSAKIHIKFSKKLDTFIEKLASYSLITFKKTGKVYEIRCPIIKDLQDKDSKYNRKRIVKKSSTTTLEEDIDIDKEVDVDTEKMFPPSLVAQIWNEFFSHEIESGELSAAPFEIGGGVHLNNFIISAGFLTTLDDWHELFVKVRTQSWLIGQPFFNFLWILNHDNLLKVQQGAYARGNDEQEFTADDIAEGIAAAIESNRTEEIPR